MRELKTEELAHVSGAGLVICPPPPCYTPCPPPPCYEPPECPEEPKTKGNNGWGQQKEGHKSEGIDDGENAGSSHAYAGGGGDKFSR